MRFKYFFILPVVWILAFLALDTLWSDNTEINSRLHNINLYLTNLLFLIGGLLAVSCFKRGDYLSKGWIWLVGCGIFLNLYCVVPVVSKFGVLDQHIELLQSTCTALGYLFAIVGLFFMSRVWKISELDLAGPEWFQLFIQLIVVALALIMAGPGAVYSFGRMLDGDYIALDWLSSALGDIICLGLAAPLLFTALALRGGLLSWPWFFKTFCLLGWLFADAIMTVLPHYYGAQPGQMNAFSEVIRTLATLFGFLAGLTQRLVIDRLRKQLSYKVSLTVYPNVA